MPLTQLAGLYRNMNDPMDDMDTLLEAEDTSPEQATPEEPTPIDPEPLGPLEPQPYRIVPQSPMPSNLASPSVEDNERPQSSQSLTLHEDMEIRGHMVKAEEGDGGVDDRTSQEQNNRDGIRASTDADTGENHDNAQNETQNPDDEPQASDRDSQGQTQGPEFSSTTRLLLPLAGFAISAALAWKFLHSQLARDLFTQAIASSAALEVVSRGLLEIGAAAARGV